MKVEFYELDEHGMIGKRTAVKSVYYCCDELKTQIKKRHQYYIMDGQVWVDTTWGFDAPGTYWDNLEKCPFCDAPIEIITFVPAGGWVKKA